MSLESSPEFGFYPYKKRQVENIAYGFRLLIIMDLFVNQLYFELPRACPLCQQRIMGVTFQGITKYWAKNLGERRAGKMGRVNI